MCLSKGRQNSANRSPVRNRDTLASEVEADQLPRRSQTGRDEGGNTQRLEWTCAVTLLGMGKWDELYGSPAKLDVWMPDDEQPQGMLALTWAGKPVAYLAEGVLRIKDYNVIARAYQVEDGRRGIVFAAWHTQDQSGEDGIVGIYGLTPWLPKKRRRDPDVLDIDHSPLYHFLATDNEARPMASIILPLYMVDLGRSMSRRKLE